MKRWQLVLWQCDNLWKEDLNNPHLKRICILCKFCNSYFSKTVFSFVFNTSTGSAVSWAVSWCSGVAAFESWNPQWSCSQISNEEILTPSPDFLTFVRENSNLSLGTNWFSFKVHCIGGFGQMHKEHHICFQWSKWQFFYQFEEYIKISIYDCSYPVKNSQSYSYSAHRPFSKCGRPETLIPRGWCRPQ